MNFDEIGRRLRLERLRIGLNQSDFAALADASLNTQTRYESGTAPKLEYLSMLAQHDVDVGYVITGIRRDRTFGHFETELLSRFGEMNDEQRSALLMAAEAMTDRLSASREPGRPPAEQEQALFTITAALTSWRMPDTDELHAEIGG